MTPHPPWSSREQAAPNGRKWQGGSGPDTSRTTERSCYKGSPVHGRSATVGQNDLGVGVVASWTLPSRGQGTYQIMEYCHCHIMECCHCKKTRPLISNKPTGCQAPELSLVCFMAATGYHNALIHWGGVTHICVSKLTIIGSDNGLSPTRRLAIIWTNAGILLIGPLGTNFSEILISIQTFSFKKMHLKMSSAKWRPFVWASMC